MYASWFNRLLQDAAERGELGGSQIISRVERELEAVTDLVKDNISKVVKINEYRSGMHYENHMRNASVTAAGIDQHTFDIAKCWFRLPNYWIEKL